MQCSAVQCSAVQTSVVDFSAILVQCSAVQYSAVQCSAVQCSPGDSERSVWALITGESGEWDKCLAAAVLYLHLHVIKCQPETGSSCSGDIIQISQPAPEGGDGVSDRVSHSCIRETSSEFRGFAPRYFALHFTLHFLLHFTLQCTLLFTMHFTLHYAVHFTLWFTLQCTWYCTLHLLLHVKVHLHYT